MKIAADKAAHKAKVKKERDEKAEDDRIRRLMKGETESEIDREE
mgnify:CR=1 FL=1|jgi:hypothetical protein